MGLVALQPVESSPTNDRTCVPCSGRWILNHWTTREVHIYLFELVFFFFGKYPEVELLGPMVVLFLIFWGITILLSIVFGPIYILSSTWRFPFSSHAYQHSFIVICCLFDDSHSDRCEVISHCGFGLHFPRDKWHWASFHVSVGHVCVFFRKMSILVFCLF